MPRLDTPHRYESFAVVEGSNAGFLDCLRYERAYPWREADARVAGAAATQWHGCRARFVVRRTTVDAATPWAPDKWTSCGWTLTPLRDAEAAAAVAAFPLMPGAAGEEPS